MSSEQEPYIYIQVAFQNLYGERGVPQQYRRATCEDYQLTTKIALMNIELSFGIKSTCTPLFGHLDGSRCGPELVDMKGHPGCLTSSTCWSSTA